MHCESHKRSGAAAPILLVLLVAGLLALLPAAAQAGPIFFAGKMEDGKFVRDENVQQPFYTIRYSTITATVDDGFAATKIQETVAGPEKAVQTVCLIPLPEGASRQGVVIAAGIPNRDHAILPGTRFLDTDEAQPVYEALAKGLDSVRILAYSGRPALLIPTFELQDKVEIVVEFKQEVQDNSGVWTLRCPTPATAFAGGPVARLSMAVTVGSRDRIPLRALFSPTHEATLQRNGLYEATVRVKADGYTGEDDFRLCWVADKDDLGLRVLAYRAEENEDGYFMLLGNPTGGEKEEAAMDKDVIFVLDTSGSMRGEKIEQARLAIEYCLGQLNPGDRFNVVTFGTEVVSFRDEPVAGSKETLAAAEEFIENVVARGLTNISGALDKVFSGKPQPGRPQITIFLTDGTPTAGELVPEKILEKVESIEPCPTQVFVMGVGHDVNAHLLDKLAEMTDGSSEYVAPEEEIDAKVAALYDRLSHPVLIDVVVDCGQLQTHSIYPQELPALFKGSEVMVFGRYRGGGAHAFRVSGILDGRQVGYTCRVVLPEAAAGKTNDFVAPLWAARKVGYLLQEIRLHGENEELIAEVVRLSKKFGIVTEYTEFLAWAGSDMTGEMALNEARARMNMANGIVVGQWAVNQGINDRNLQFRVVATQDGNNYLDRRGNTVVNNSLRQIGDQVYYLRDGQWVNGEESDGQKTRVVELFSDEYYDLLRNNTRFAQAQRLGWAVATNIGNQRIIVQKNGEQKDAELQKQYRFEQSLRMEDMRQFHQGLNQLENVQLRDQLRNEARFEQFRNEQRVDQFQNQIQNGLRINQMPNGQFQFDDRNIDRIEEFRQIPDEPRNVQPVEER